MKKFLVYDKVWIMSGNRPEPMMVFAVIESMDYYKQGTEIHYRLVQSQIGAGWGNNDGIQVEESSVFATREQCVASLLAETP